ncbi:outer membrane protein assembly factor BamB family protein [Tenacibaculum ovolyticum]|uniref:outer membrane protein assembly factor BamB family protein n=1 Tax=Tenacibaculum ovolyticum TaxID=104270 RepID=UPI001F3927DC|nr:PQQ-binding-like beta-propeller repeat protein [Tenacibaculum ovolyticum]
MFNLKRFLTLLIITVSFVAFSQRKASKTLTFKDKVKDLIVVPFNGISVISEGDNIHGYDSTKDEMLWTVLKEKNITLDITEANGKVNLDVLGSLFPGKREFSIINDTPFIQLFYSNKLYVYNSFSGELIFKPSNNESYFDSKYLFDENALLLYGVTKGKLIVAKYLLSDKKFAWKTPVSDQFLNFFKSFLKLNPTAFKDKLTYTKNKVFALIKTKFYTLDKSTGKLLWKSEEKNILDYKNSLDGNKLITIKKKGFFGFKNEIELYDVPTGDKIWKKPLSTKFLILFEDWQDKMLLAHYKGFNFYDYSTGKKLWKKDPKGKGIKSVIPIDGDFLYVYDDEMMLIDKDGKKLWRGDVTISDNDDDPIFFLEKTNNNRILYVTSTYANMVDYKTGKKVWSKNLKLNEKRPTFADYDAKSGNFIVFNDEELYKFNENSTKRPKPFSKLKLKSEKTISSMILFPNNISISGQSEVVGVDFSGKLLFHKKYSQPGEFGRKLFKGLSQAAQAASAVATAEVTVTTEYKDSKGNSVKNSNTSALFGERTKAIGEAGYIAAGVATSFLKDRFNAMQETNKYALIFAKGENKAKLLVKVNKETGEEIDKIVLENNKPVYDVDFATDIIYYSRKNQVKIFK